MRDDTTLALTARLEEQQALIERLEARLAGVETQQHREPDNRDHAVIARGERTDRRHLLTKAATATVGAVVGGAAMAIGQASPAAAASGTFTGDPAVEATAVPSSGTAIVAESITGDGVSGNTQSGYGVRAEADSGFGAYCGSYTGYGMYGVSTLNCGVAASCGPEGRSQLFLESLDGGIAPPLTRTDLHQSGEICRDYDDDLWLCVGSGIPGSWRRIAGPATAGAFIALPTPIRVYDSRPGQVPIAVGPKTPLAANTPRVVDLKGNGSGVPEGATAVSVNLIATGTTSAIGGFMSIYRNGIGFPGTSNLNWSGPAETVAVTTITAVDGNALCQVYAGSVTDVVVDVLGYYQ